MFSKIAENCFKSVSVITLGGFTGSVGSFTGSFLVLPHHFIVLPDLILPERIPGWQAFPHSFHTNFPPLSARGAFQILALIVFIFFWLCCKAPGEIKVDVLNPNLFVALVQNPLLHFGLQYICLVEQNKWRKEELWHWHFVCHCMLNSSGILSANSFHVAKIFIFHSSFRNVAATRKMYNWHR